MFWLSDLKINRSRFISFWEFHRDRDTDRTIQFTECIRELNDFSDWNFLNECVQQRAYLIFIQPIDKCNFANESQTFFIDMFDLLAGIFFFLLLHNSTQRSKDTPWLELNAQYAQSKQVLYADKFVYQRNKNVNDNSKRKMCRENKATRCNRFAESKHICGCHNV